MKTIKLIAAYILLLILTSCRSSIAVYDHYAYSQTTALKVDAIDVMEHASEHFADYSKQVKMVELNMRKLMEYERHRPGNKLVNVMWEKLQDPKANLYGGFINRWRERSQLDTNFVADQCRIVGLAFDQIAELQSKLIKRK